MAILSPSLVPSLRTDGGRFRELQVVEDIVAATVERLSEVPGIGNARAEKLQAFCRL